ncbi:MAG TPA: MarR family transcriptional regulator [Candidatus Limnocylindria bacterium]|nr:MarR family transcriptional regulator [Candidatus Limnocylindria bacterium]
MSTPDAGSGGLRRLINEAIGMHEVVAASLGLNATDLRCVELASSEPEMTPSRLAQLSDLTSGAVTGVLDRLERAGFVRRESDPNDRRRQLVRVDPHKREVLEAKYAPIIGRAVADAAKASPGIADAYLPALAEALGREADRLRVETYGGMFDDAYHAPLGGVVRARLVLHTNAPRLNLGKAAFGQQVRMVAETASTRLKLRAATPDGELIRAAFVGPAPDVRTSDGTVTMRYRRRVVDTRSREIQAALHPAAAWRIEIENGITDLEADLRKLSLVGIDVHGGVNHFRLRLPHPSGTVRIAIEGGVSEGRLTRPAGVPALLITDGVSHLQFDDRERQSSGAELRVRSRAYDRAPDRYEVEIGGGISDLVIDEE